MENWTKEDQERFNDIQKRVSPQFRVQIPHGYEIMFGTLMNDLQWMVEKIIKNSQGVKDVI